MKTVVMSWRMPRDTRLALEREAWRRSVRVCDLVRTALDEWFEIHEPVAFRKMIAEEGRRERRKTVPHHHKK